MRIGGNVHIRKRFLYMSIRGAQKQKTVLIKTNTASSISKWRLFHYLSLTKDPCFFFLVSNGVGKVIVKGLFNVEEHISIKQLNLKDMDKQVSTEDRGVYHCVQKRPLLCLWFLRFAVQNLLLSRKSHLVVIQ